MTDVLESKESLENDMLMNFGIPVALEDLDFLFKLDELIAAAREDGVVFKRSKDPSSSFYPRVHILRLKDIDRTKLSMLQDSWKAFQSSVPLDLSLKIKGFTRTVGGLLLMEFDSGSDLENYVTGVASGVQGFRTGSNDVPLGDRYFSTSLHLTMGMNVLESDMGKINEAVNASGVIGQEMKFNMPLMYTKPEGASWSEECEIVVL